MTNPTREQIEQRLEQVLIGPSNTVQMSLPDYQRIHRFALRVLDMIDGIRRVLETPCGVEQRRLVLNELAKFDEKEVKSK